MRARGSRRESRYVTKRLARVHVCGVVSCDACVACTTDEWKLDEIALQVEEGNTAAITLYRKDGYREVYRAISRDAAATTRVVEGLVEAVVAGDGMEGED